MFMCAPVNPELVVAALAAREVTVATAESLTAGLVAATIAEVPGASRVLRGGLVVYATELKHTLAGVPRDVLTRHGAVSPETAELLAEGARRVCGADLGVGLTGVAGPDPQEGRPPGTVFIAVVGPGSRSRRVAPLLTGSRAEIRTGACTAALAQIAAALGNEPRA